MKYYKDYVDSYNKILKNVSGKKDMMIVKRHIYICFNFLSDNGVTAHPGNKKIFKAQLMEALGKFPEEDQYSFLTDIAKTVGIVNLMED